MTAKTPRKVHLRLRFQNLGKPRTAGLCGRAADACDCGPLSVLLSNGLHHSENLPVKFGFSPQIVPANIVKKLPSQRCPQPFLIAFFNFSHKWPTFAFTGESGYTLGFRRRIAHSGSHGETRAFPPSATARSCAASEIATIRTAGGSGCTPMACVRFLRRRGPAGLRDLFRFCRNCGLYALRSGPFRVCEARGGITTLSALYVLLKRRTAACQKG